MKSFVLAAAVAAAAVASVADAQTPTAAPTGCGSPTTTVMTTDQGPVVGQNKPCVFPFTAYGKTYTSCISFQTAKPVLRGITMAPSTSATWCALQANYKNADTQKSKLWGFCDCAAAPTTEYEVPSVAPTVAPTPPPGTLTMATSGGYVPEGTPCLFPLTFNDGKTFTECIPMTAEKPVNKGSGSTGTKPRAPKAPVTTAAWCYTGYTAAPTSSPAVLNYNTLPKAQQTTWTYCTVTSPTNSPSSAAPTVKPTAGTPTTKPPTVKPTTSSPTTRAPTTAAPTTTTNGGYQPNGTPCKLPFTYKKGTKSTTYTTCAPTSGNAPFINTKNLPSQPTPPNTNGTWCYTGAGVYDTSVAAKRTLWGFCATGAAPTLPPVTGIPTAHPTPSPVAPSAGPPTTPAPVPTPNPTNIPTRQPTSVTAAPVSVPPSPPSNTSAPTRQPTTPTVVPPSTSGNSSAPTRRPTTRPTNNTNGTNGTPTSSPTQSATSTVQVTYALAAVVAVAAFVAA